MKTQHPRARPLLAAFVAMLVLAALDQTILSTALPAISAELHGQDRLSWVFSAYLMASTVAIPLYGRLADARGTRVPLLAAVALFFLGSLACALADNMTALILARGLQGAGGGGLLTLTLLGVGELVPAASRAAWQGLMGGVYGLATLFGPPLGAVLVQHFSWHWTFFINLPIALAALAALAWGMPRATAPAGEPQRLDLAGAVLLAGALVSLLLATRRGAAWAGAWGAGAMLVSCALLSLAWVWWQRRARHPIVPLTLFARPAFSASVAISAASGVALFSAVVFVPTYLQTALLKSPTASAWHLLPLMAGITVSAMTAGRSLRAGVPLRGLAVGAAGLMALSLAALALVFRLAPSQPYALSACLLPLGVGIGTLFPAVTALAQRSAPARHLGVATSTPVMVRALGGAVGVSALGSLLTARITEQLGAVPSPSLSHAAFADAFAAAAQPVYLAAASVCLLAGAGAWLGLARHAPAPEPG